MATNEVVERNDIWLMDGDELQEHLMEAGFSEQCSVFHLHTHSIPILNARADGIFSINL